MSGKELMYLNLDYVRLGYLDLEPDAFDGSRNH